jgi:hypothetical protein
MQASQTPTLVPLAFAASGTKNVIPENSQIGITPGAASLQDGFPPLTFTPIAAGGVPPAGADFNGVLNLITQTIRWVNAGGHFKYNSTFASDANVGGYPAGAILLNAAGTGIWQNTVDGNTTNPDTGGAGWIAGFSSPLAVGAATQSSQAINLGQLTSTGSPLALTTTAATLANQAVNLGQFASSFGTSSFQKLAGGLIIQGGLSTTITAGTLLTINYPLAFPNGVFSIVGSISSNATTAAAFVTTKSITNSQFGLALNSGTGSAYWIALGF